MSVRSMASRVRPVSPAFRKLISPAPTFATVLGKSPRAASPARPRAPFMYEPTATGSPPRSMTLVTSPSETVVSGSCPGAASSTVRLVPEGERYLPNSPDSDDSLADPGKTEDDSVESSPVRERFSLVTELVSSYYTDGHNIYEFAPEEHFYKNPESRLAGLRSRVHINEEAHPGHARRDDNDDSPLEEGKPQLSWFLTLFLLCSVTVVCLTLTLGK